MPAQLKISIGQFSTAGRKEANQDFYGAYVPTEPLLSSKGIAIAIADGISTSSVSRVASESAVKGFLEDYFCTSPAWSVKRSARAVLAAMNSWLYSQTRQSQFRYEQDRGYVCTFTAIVFKSTTAHLFHVGDARVYRQRDDTLEQLTQDHRVWISAEQSYLGKALGVNAQLEIDYQAVSIEPGDTFLIVTDGVHETVASKDLFAHLVADDDLETVAGAIAADAYARGSHDNLTVQIARVDTVPEAHVSEVHQQLNDLPLPPALEPRMEFEGYTIIRPLHASHRSHIHLALDSTTKATVALKTPSVDLQADTRHLERFLLEDWIARRINSPHVVKAFEERRKRHYLYTALEFVEGQTLAQWMIDNPRPTLEQVRVIIDQVAKGLMAFHRLEMLHQDLRPENIMIDTVGTVRIVDFGSVRVAGLVDLFNGDGQVLGAIQYAAPECFLGEQGTVQSDVYSMAVTAYQMLCGRLPYGAEVPRRTTRAAQRKLRYRSLLAMRRDIPAWVDEVLRKATHPDPRKRYADAAEFVHALRYPTSETSPNVARPLLERDPVVFWKVVSLLLLVLVLFLGAQLV